MRITSKGQVTIPARIRTQADLHPHTEVEFVYEGRGTVRLVRASKKSRKPSRGEVVVARLRGRGDVKLTTDQIMALTRGGR